MSNDTLDGLDSSEIDDKFDISGGRGLEDNSFDSLLSPSKACDWLSADPFDLSSNSNNSADDPRMVRIQPKIKEKSSKRVENLHGESQDSLLIKNSERSVNTKEISVFMNDAYKLLSPPPPPPSRNQAAVPNLGNFSPMSGRGYKGFGAPSHVLEDFHNPVSMTPPLYSPFVINHFYPIVPPPSAFQTPPVPPPSLPLSTPPYQTPRVKSNKASLSNVSYKYVESSRISLTNTEACPQNKSPLFFQFPPAANLSSNASQNESLETPHLTSVEKNPSSVTSVSLQSEPTNKVASSVACTPSKVGKLSQDDSIQWSSPSKSPQTTSPSHLAWDSTFEALKTLECSMKLVVTPLHKKLNETYEDSPQESNDSQLSAGPGDKSCVSGMSLDWDNTGELLAGTDLTSPQSLNSSMQSLDIDEIIGRVAPNLCDGDPLLTPMPKYNPSFITPRASQLSAFETSSPFLHKQVPGNDMKAMIDDSPLFGSDPGSNDDKTFIMNSVLCASQLGPFDSPCPNRAPTAEVYVIPPSGGRLLLKPDSPDDLYTCLSPSDDYLFPPVQGCHLRAPSPALSDSSNLTVPSLPGSPNSDTTGDFLSACDSLDSYSTVFEL
eukprot:GFUD01033063.1.p1 GENE.GFUD01033063.1~~GFUD01033063.1.p1  ORF type:complete len:605 (-),score=115.11 GFUD01033063.1:95-1909(-)